MYFITYKNTMRSGTNMQDFLEWLTTAWPVQKEWGADDVTYWQCGDEKLIICQYHVSDLTRWLKMAQSPAGQDLSRRLEKIIDLDSICLKVTKSDGCAA